MTTLTDNAPATNPIYARRRRADIIVRLLCVCAAIFGVTWLALILFTLFWNGLSGLSAQVFTEMTPPPGSSTGGLLNAIVGSLIMTLIGVGIGAPLGMLAGTFMAEYGRHDRLTSVVRFINDILLSAPSIIIGLFIYGAVVVPMGGFSALAGALALAVIVIPSWCARPKTCFFWCRGRCAKRPRHSACRARW